jgi:sigma-B regulation protein RsbU (phosphoserine phosphatase)
MPHLAIKTGPLAGKRVLVKGPVTLGRGSSADIDLLDRSVSRRHATVAPERDAWLLTDLETANGTYVDGERVGRPTRLRDGASLRFGSVEALFESGASAGSPITEPILVFEETSTRRPPSIMLRIQAVAPGLSPQQSVSEGASLRLEFLSELAGLLGHTFDEDALLRRILEKLFELLPQAERGFVLMKEGNDGHLATRVVHSRSGEAGPVVTSRSLLREVVEKREGILSADVLGDQRLAKATSVFSIGLRTLMCVPILDETEVYGVIQVDSTRPGLPFRAEDMLLVLAVTRQLALALANARLHARLLEQELLRHDLLLAGKVQQRFLPRNTPEVPGYGIAVEYTPAEAVGGDFYSFLNLKDGRLGIAVGDVSGKGVSAALCMAKITSDLRYHSVGQTEPGEILRRLNLSLCGDLDEGMFVTVVLLILDPRTAELRISRAGHPPPVVRESHGSVVTLGAGDGPALGLYDTARFEQTLYTLDHHDVVVLYTDGVTEALDRGRNLYGEERLAKAIGGAARGARGVREAILADLESFVGSEDQSDDLTLVCLGIGSD